MNIVYCQYLDFAKLSVYLGNYEYNSLRARAQAWLASLMQSIHHYP